MSIEDQTFELQFEIKDYTEIYAPTKKLLRWTRVRIRLIITAIFLLLTGVFYIFSFKYGNLAFLIVIFSIFTAVLFLMVIADVLKFYKWRRKIDEYLKGIAESGTQRINLSDNAVEVINNSSTTINKWEHIVSTKISNYYILLIDKGGEECMIPTMSMDLELLNKLKEFIMRRIKDPLASPTSS